MSAPGIEVSYTRLASGKIARQVCVGDGVIFDVDAGGRIAGVETIGQEDWRNALATLAMTGRLRIARKPGA